MATFETFHTSRKVRRCESERGGDCTRQIEPGQRYCLSVLTPNHDGLGNEGWWRMRLCAPCATFYGHKDSAMVGGE